MISIEGCAAVPVRQQYIDEAVAKAKEYMARSGESHSEFLIGLGAQMALEMLCLWPKDKETP